MKSSAETVHEYLDEIGPEKAAVVRPLLEDIRSVIHPGFEEVMNWGMISYQVPLSLFPDTYNQKPLLYCSLAAQKHHVALYLMPAYAESTAYDLIVNRYESLGLKLDMGKCCLRLKTLAEVDRGVVKEIVGMYDPQEWISHYRSCRNQTG